MKLMQKFFSVACVLALTASLTTTVFAANSGYGLIVNGETATFEAGTEPINVEGRLLFPLRTVFNAINDGSGDLDWDEANRMVTISLRDREVVLRIDNPEAEVNGVTVPVLDGIAPIIHNDRTYLPLRFIAEQFDMVVGWNDEHAIASVVDRNVYETVRTLLLESESDSNRLSCDLSMVMDTSISINTANVIEQQTSQVNMVGSFNIDLENDFTHIVATSSATGSTPGFDVDFEVEMYISRDEMFLRVDGEWITVESNDHTDLGFDSSGIMNSLDMADLEAMAEVFDDFDPYLTLGYSVNANGNTTVSGVIFLPAEEMSDLILGIQLDQFDINFVSLYTSPINVEYIFSQETGNMISMEMEFTMTVRMHVEGQPVDLLYSYTIRLDNINLNPDFVSVIPDSVRNQAQ